MRLVEAWIESARQIGPPRGSFQVGDLSSDLYVAPVERANVRATFVAVEQDRFMRVMSFR